METTIVAPLLEAMQAGLFSASPTTSTGVRTSSSAASLWSV